MFGSVRGPAWFLSRKRTACRNLALTSLILSAVLLIRSGPPGASPVPQRAVIHGLVRNEKGPVAAAVVRVKGTTRSTVTDLGGRFTLSGLESGRAAAVTAWAPGHYVGGGQAVLPSGQELIITLVHYAPDDNRDYAWLPSLRQVGEGENQGCAECHSRQGTDLSFSLPVDEWLQDIHSRSAVNPRFLTMYDGSDITGRRSEETRFFSVKDYGTFPLPPDPDLPYYGPGYKLDFPQTEGNCAACHTPVAAANNPVTTDPRGLTGTAAEGISCDLCHKVIEVKLDPKTGLPRPNAPGVLSLEFRRPHRGHQLFAGPYDDVAPGEDTFAPVQRESRFCAACHFGVFWDTIIYNSFGEWLESPYSQPGLGKTCQDCHMPPLGVTHFARPDKGAVARDPATIFSHRMPGAADADLLRHAVTLSLAATKDRGQITARVTITNDRTGHHVPTDSPLRQMILLVDVAGGDGREFALINGPVLPSWCGPKKGKLGHYAGLAGMAFAKVLEEKWTRFTPSGAYWNPTRIVSDNRLAALASNTSTYIFEAPAGQRVEVRARLIYRRAFIELMDAKGWDSPDILMQEAHVSLPPRARSPRSGISR